MYTVYALYVHCMYTVHCTMYTVCIQCLLYPVYKLLCYTGECVNTCGFDIIPCTNAVL